MLMTNADKVVRSKPFPWKCSACGADSVYQEIVSYPASIGYDGRAYRFPVDGLKSPQCRKCGKIHPDAEANKQISLAFRAHAKLLTPEQIRRNREELGLTQQQLASALGVADTTLSRWETGKQIQQRSLDKALRIYFAFPGVRRALADDSRFAQLGIDVNHTPHAGSTDLPNGPLNYLTGGPVT
jgi:putative zinc finger/helix-turn-helix YgiT family protein